MNDLAHEDCKIENGSSWLLFILLKSSISSLGPFVIYNITHMDQGHKITLTLVIWWYCIVIGLLGIRCNIKLFIYDN